MNLKRGMSHFDPNDIKLKFKTYFNKKALPAVPLRFGHVHHDAPRGGWGMLGNDQFGDCTIAGIAHGQMVWNWAVRGDIPVFSSDVIVAQYLTLSGGQDTGLDPTQVAKWWKDDGLKDAAGKNHVIRSYTAVDQTMQAIEAAYLFGFSGLGLWLPENAENQFINNEVWSDTSDPPQPNAGHYVPLVGRNSAGNLMVVTWGRLQAMTPQWFEKYFAGGVAYTSMEYMRNTGKSPEGFKIAELDADLEAL